MASSSFANTKTPPPWQFLSLRITLILYPSGKISPFEKVESSFDSVPITISGRISSKKAWKYALLAVPFSPFTLMFTTRMPDVVIASLRLLSMEFVESKSCSDEDG